MQTAQEIQNQVNQVKREIIDISNSLDRITNTQDLIAAEGELSNRQNVLNRLQVRLQEAREREQVQEKQDRRAELERQRDAATAEHAELDSAFEAEMLDGEAYILDLLDRLDEIATQRGNVSTRHANALFELRGRQVNWSDDGHLSSGNGWFSNATEHARSDVRRVLFELYAARKHLRGLLQLPGQDNGYGSLLVTRTPVLEQPDSDDAFRAQIGAEFAAKRALNGS